MSKFILVVGLLALGCGASDGGSGSPLEGGWQVTLASGCVGQYTFSGANFSDSMVCELNSGSYGDEIESGTFATHGNEIDFVPVKSSCPTDAAAETYAFAIQGQNLLLTPPNSSTQIIFEKTAAPGTVAGGAVIETGCWDASSSGQPTLTPHPVQNL